MRIARGISIANTSKPISTAIVYDADAAAYFTANTAITSTADKNAINDFYLGLKSDGIYTKIKAMYLPIWGSASTSKWNLVNPLDTEAAFRMSYSTGWTFSSGGALPNGTSAYADTFLTPSTALALNSAHLSVYIRTNNASLNSDIGSSNASFVNGLYINSRFTSDNNAYARTNGTDINFLNHDSKGFYISSKTASTTTKFFKNTTSYSSASASTGITSFKTIIGGINQANTIGYCNRQLSFSSIGDGLTDTEATNFYNRVQTLMTYFAINV